MSTLYLHMNNKCAGFFAGSHVCIEINNNTSSGTGDCSVCGVNAQTRFYVFMQSIPVHIYAKVLSSPPNVDLISSLYKYTSLDAKCSICKSSFQYVHVLCLCLGCHQSIVAPYCSASFNAQVDAMARTHQMKMNHE